MNSPATSEKTVSAVSVVSGVRNSRFAAEKIVFPGKKNWLESFLGC
jgi:hypothetical protein